ncbi:hypothetical protein BCR32DRAFT_279308 [Anaeromyces robustus]|uniref:Uncharacterized protein n=1 Tax=Anaeromyces robustus TaxID=1754192 RepID=A0A1Y1X8A2_9FUNG|nr:hypothetical protein BCR32DRAFT_279308 [Anaeromyces robustus]|eukprot:ORX81989.1 hypothetical protein BCR32DRAFT_279308 [Anaeromyces robustus]
MFKTLPYNTIKSGKSSYKECTNVACISYNCTTDTQYYNTSYMRCDKLNNDECDYNNKCSSKKCTNGFCVEQIDGPSDSENTLKDLA